jgi:hypothetical protein
MTASASSVVDIASPLQKSMVSLSNQIHALLADRERMILQLQHVPRAVIDPNMPFSLLPDERSEHVRELHSKVLRLKDLANALVTLSVAAQWESFR